MKVLVCPHNLSMGGSQLNAIELAGGIQALGHEAVIYAPPGILSDRVRALGLPFVPAPDSGSHKERRKGLNQLVEDGHIDLIHTYEWGPSLDASFSSGVRNRTPVLASVMSMHVPEFLPRHLPIIVGTPALSTELAWKRRTAFLLEPPVNMDWHRTADIGAARAALGMGSDEVIVSVVTMLTTELEKLQGVLDAVALIDRIAEETPVRLLIAGDGEGLEQVRKRATAVNKRHHRTVIDVLGYLDDPRAVYEAADIVLGMGTSAIKGLAFSKALVVQGEAGFWKALTEENAEEFLGNGWFGYEGRGVADLERELRSLIGDPELRTRRGAFGRNLVEQRYSLERAAKELERIYLDLLAHRENETIAARTTSLLRSAVEVSKFRNAMKTGAPTDREKYSHSGVQL